MIARSHVPGITPTQWVRVNAVLREPGAVLEVPYLRSATGIHTGDALQLIQLLIAEKLADEYTLTYHCAEHPVAVESKRPTITYPWECPECEEVVEEDDLVTIQREIRAVLKQPVSIDP